MGGDKKVWARVTGRNSGRVTGNPECPASEEQPRASSTAPAFSPPDVDVPAVGAGDRDMGQAVGSCKVAGLVSSPIYNTGGELGGVGWLQLELEEPKS